MKRLIAVATLALFLLPGAALAQVLSVKGPKANFRKGPSVKNEIVYTADRNFPVKILKRQKGWVRVEDFEGQKAWVLEKLLTKQKALVVKHDKANIRDKPNLKSNVLFTADHGAAFKVIKVTPKWALVQHADGDRGWIYRSLTWGI